MTAPETSGQAAADQVDASGPSLALLQIAVLVVAICGIAYELVIAAVSSYLLGNSVTEFSITIGLFMFAMGIGSLLSRGLSTSLIERFLAVEIVIALIGGFSSTALFVVFPWTFAYRPFSVILILVIGALVGLELPILTRVLTRGGSLRKSIAHVLALDYFGALIGSVAFPLLLLPTLGLFRASFAIALLNIAIVLLTVLSFAKRLRRPGLWLAAVAVVTALLISGMVLDAWIHRFAEGRLYSDRVILRKQTPYQRIVVTRSERTGLHRLYLDGHLQFAEVDEYRYHEALVHPVLSLPGSRQRVLILGGGDGLAARRVLEYPDVGHIDLVDIDPAMTRLAGAFAAIRKLNGGSLEDPRVTVHNQDAFAFVRNEKRQFDRVIIDLPDPHNEALAKLYSVEFYRLLAGRLAPGGFLVTQASSPWRTRQVFWAIRETLREAGMRTFSYRVLVPSFGVWGFHVASPDGPVPHDWNLPDGNRFLTRDVLARASRFAPDEAPLDVPANSIFDPTIYMLYLRELNP